MIERFTEIDYEIQGYEFKASKNKRRYFGKTYTARYIDRFKVKGVEHFILKVKAEKSDITAGSRYELRNTVGKRKIRPKAGTRRLYLYRHIGGRVFEFSVKNLIKLGEIPLTDQKLADLVGADTE